MTPDPPPDTPDPAPPVRYLLCPRCGRAVPSHLEDRYCANDGATLLSACPRCDHPILSPFARHCTRCGTALTRPEGAL